VPNGWFWCAFCKLLSFGSWQSTQSAGADLVRWFRFSGVGSAPVLCVTWHVSHPISSAACLLPFSGTFKPVVWQLRHKFSFTPPDVGSAIGTCLSETVRVVALQAIPHRWLVHQSLDLRRVLVRVAGEAQRLRVVVVSLTRVNILVHSNFVTRGAPIEIAVCTAFPFAFSAWHSRHFAESVFFSAVPDGCPLSPA